MTTAAACHAAYAGPWVYMLSQASAPVPKI
jgi:hypothetical protein